MRGHGTTCTRMRGHGTSRTRMRGHGTGGGIFPQVFPPFYCACLEAADQFTQRFRQGFLYKRHEMQMLGHQLHFQYLHLRIMQRHFCQRFKCRHAIGGWIDEPTPITRARMRGYGTGGRFLAQMSQPFTSSVRQRAGNHVDAALCIIPVLHPPCHPVDCLPRLHARYYNSNIKTV